MIGWLISHHVTSIMTGVLALAFAGAVLRQRRPTGSTLAWLLIIVLVPYAGIPLFLMLGGRKFQRRRRGKAPISLSPPRAVDRAAGPFGIRGLGTETTMASAEWLTEGVEAYERILREIRGATESIHIVTFVVGNDATGIGVLEALAERATKGVRVRLLLDDFLSGRAPRASLARLRAAGGKIERFMPLVHLPFRGQANLRNHRKIAIFDGRCAIVGGMNLADEYMGREPRKDRWRDLSVALRGQAASTLDAIFRADWEFASMEQIPATAVPAGARSDVPVVVVPSGPDAPSDPIYDALLTAVFRVEKRFWVSTPYFIPDETLLKALVLAVRRGIDVRIVVPAVSNHRLADLAAGPPLRELEKAGASVTRLDRMLHAKAVLVDDAQAVIGSANFDMRSLFLDYEVAIVISERPEVERLAMWFDETMRLPSIVPPQPGVLRSSVEGIVRLAAPLL